MYAQTAFREERPEVLARAIREIRAATFVTHTADGYQASHMPVILRDEGGAWTLECHMARANPHWRALAAGPLPTIAIFQGPEAYVSPSWYETKQLTGKAVPTWAYVAVHAEGPLEVLEDEAYLRRHLDALTEANEKGRDPAWEVSDAPPDFVSGLLKAIVGLRMTVERVQGSWKLNQHKGDGDKRGVIEGLAASERAQDREIAALMRAAKRERSGG